MNQPQTIFNINYSGQSDYQVFSNSWIQSRNQNNIYGSNTGSNMNQDFVPNPYLEYLEKQAKTQGNQNNYGQEFQIALNAPIPLSNTNNSQPVNAAINNQGTSQEEQIIVIPPQTQEEQRIVIPTQSQDNSKRSLKVWSSAFTGKM